MSGSQTELARESDTLIRQFVADHTPEGKDLPPGKIRDMLADLTDQKIDETYGLKLGQVVRLARDGFINQLEAALEVEEAGGISG